MSLPEFTIAVWVIPHRGHGHLIEVNASDVDEGFPGGVYQSFEHVEASRGHPQFQPDYPHQEVTVSTEQVEHLLQLADQTHYSFAEHGHTPMLEGAFFGLRVTRGFQVATVVWHGAFEDQQPDIRSLFSAVEALVKV
jgi:hypothetical protein